MEGQRTNNHGSDLCDLANIIVGLHDALDPGHGEFCLDFYVLGASQHARPVAERERVGHAPRGRDPVRPLVPDPAVYLRSILAQVGVQVQSQVQLASVERDRLGPEPSQHSQQVPLLRVQSQRWEFLQQPQQRALLRILSDAP